MSRKRRELRQLTIDGGYIVEASKDLQSTWGGARQGAGRPRSRPDSKTVSVRLPMYLYEYLDKGAEALDLTVSELLRGLVEDHYNSRNRV